MAQQLLELQKFILANPSDWKEKLQAKPYCLKIQEDDDLALFKYSQIDSDFSETICCEARGVILERDTWKIVRFAFRKFFNLGEPHADKIDWESATATSKEDGSLISLYYYKGWQIATNGNLYAWNAPLGVAGFQTFEDLAMEALLKYNVDFRSLNKNYTYTFELCSPYNQIVCSYPDIQLFHTVTVDNRTLEEVDVEIGVPKPKFYNLNSKVEYEELVNSLPENTEGIVVRDKFGKRVKIKTKLYFELHRLVNNGHIDVEKALQLILENDYEELLAYYPNYTNFFSQVKDAYKNALDYIGEVRSWTTEWERKNLLTATHEGFVNARKIFAAAVKDKPIPSLYFLAYDGKLKKFEDDLTAKKILSVFRNYFEGI